MLEYSHKTCTARNTARKWSIRTHQQDNRATSSQQTTEDDPRAARLSCNTRSTATAHIEVETEGHDPNMHLNVSIEKQGRGGLAVHLLVCDDKVRNVSVLVHVLS